jgi:hypothetical protein
MIRWEHLPLEPATTPDKTTGFRDRLFRRPNSSNLSIAVSIARCELLHIKNSGFSLRKHKLGSKHRLFGFVSGASCPTSA